LAEQCDIEEAPSIDQAPSINVVRGRVGEDGRDCGLRGEDGGAQPLGGEDGGRAFHRRMAGRVHPC
jgi:hypothetical protein